MRRARGAWTLWGAILLGLFAVGAAWGSTSRVVMIEDFDDTS